MKHLIGYCNVTVVFGLLILVGVCEQTDMIRMGPFYLILLLCFVIVKLPPSRKLLIKLMGQVWGKLSIALSVTGVIAIWGAVIWHVVIDDRYCYFSYLPDRIAECASLISLMHIQALIMYVPFMIPWRAIFSGERYSDYLEFMYKVLRLLIIAYISLIVLVLILGGLLACMEGGDAEDVLGAAAIMSIYGFLSLIPLQAFKPSIERARQRRAMRVLIHINHAIKANLPLVHVLDAASNSEQGQLAKRLDAVSRLIARGESISVAIKAAVPEFRPQQIRQLKAADHIGYLPQAIERLVEQMAHQHSHSITSTEPGWRYILFNLFGGSMLIGAVMIFIVPKFEKIFEDFDTALPDVSINLLQTSRWFGGALPGQQVPGILWVLIPVSLFVMLWNARHGEHPLSRLYQWLAWHLPLCRMVHLPAEMAKVSQQLADGLDAAMSLEKVVANLRAGTSHVMITAMLRRFDCCLNQGHDLANSAKLAGFPRQFVMMLGTSAQQQTLPQVMHYMAEYYQMISRQRSIWFRSMVTPLVVLVVGIPVGWICIGLFTPLVVLIEHCVMVTGVY